MRPGITATIGRKMDSNSPQMKNLNSIYRITFGFILLLSTHIGHTIATKCEQITVKRCMRMPWTLTHMPNLVHHSSQENAELVLSQFEPLLSIHCSVYLEFFLCSMFTPMCFHHEGEFPKIVPPCRKICQDARNRCEPIMLKYNVTWPEQLSCHDLPEYHRGMCIEPDAFIQRQTESPDEPPRCSAASPVKCKKCKRFKMKDKVFFAKDYDFVIRAKIEKVIQNPCDASVKINVTQVFKMKTILIGPGPNVLTFNDSCACPKLKRGREYILGGYENSSNGDLLLQRESMAEKWGRKWEKKIGKWVKKKAKTPLNRRRRTNESAAPPKRTRKGRKRSRKTPDRK
ncbi:secreted frizzled-related protein 3-like [Styela clava]